VEKLEITKSENRLNTIDTIPDAKWSLLNDAEELSPEAQIIFESMQHLLRIL
jgi:hypothetical protein